MKTTGFIATCIWVYGIVLASGFWSTCLAICIPQWAWYLVIEKVAKYFNLL